MPRRAGALGFHGVQEQNDWTLLFPLSPPVAACVEEILLVLFLNLLFVAKMVAA